MKYKCTITSGGGTEYDGGDFEIKETPKTITFNCVREPFFSNRMTQKDFIKEESGIKFYQQKPLKINKYYRDKKPAWRYVTINGLESLSYMNNGHVVRFWLDDNSITVYPDQCGTPHYFEQIIEDN